MKRTSDVPAWLGAILLAAGLAACSSGGSGGGSTSATDVAGLELASNMSVVAAQDESSGGAEEAPPLVLLMPASVATVDYPANTDYAADPTHSYVWDESMQSLEMVNQILCYMGQVRATEMVNKGPYIALVNEDKCEKGENQSSVGASGQSSGGNLTEYNRWTVISTRDSNNAPQIVKIWVPGEPNPADPMDGMTIVVETTIYEGVSATKPYGDFVLNFKGVGDDGVLQGGAPNGVEVLLMQGTLRTVDNAEGKPQFQYYNEGGTAANPALASVPPSL